MNYRNEWIATINGVSENLINVKFTGRCEAVFSRSMLDIIKTDPACEWITDNDSGELLYYKD